MLKNIMIGLSVVMSVILCVQAQATQRPDAPESGPQSAKKDDVIRSFAVVGFPTIAQGTDNDWLGVGLGEDLATRLGQVEGVFSVERLQLNLALASYKINMLKEGVSAEAKPDRTEQARLVNLGKVIKGGNMMAADYVIVGSLWMSGKFGDKNTVIKANVRLVKTETSEVLEAVSVQGSGDQKGYMRMQEDLAEALAEKMGIPEDKRIKVSELKHRAATGDSYEAFVKARKLLYEGKYAEAIESCHKSELLGVNAILEQLRNTENQAREQLLKTEKDPKKAKALADEYVGLQERRVGEKNEELAIESYYAGESWMQKGDKLEELGDRLNAKSAWAKAMDFYDAYLKTTSMQPVLWEHDVKSDIGTMYVIDGIVFASSQDGLRALEARTGKLLWNYAVATEVRYDLRIADGNVYAISVKGDILALEIKTGKLLWEFHAKSEAHTVEVMAGIVHVGTTDNSIRSFDAKNGKLLWEFQDNDSISLPFVANGKAFMGLKDGRLRAYEAKGGNLLWSFESEGWIQSPVVVDGIVYAGSQYGHVRAFDENTGKVLWDTNIEWKAVLLVNIVEGIAYALSHDGLRAFNSRTGDLLWHYKADEKMGVPTGKDGIIYTESETGHFRMFDAKSGNLLWELENPEYITVEVANGIAYAGSSFKSSRSAIGWLIGKSKGPQHLQAFDAQTGRHLWDFKAGDWIKPPVVAEGIAYSESEDGHLRAFDVGTGNVLMDYKAEGKVKAPVMAGGVAYTAINGFGNSHAVKKIIALNHKAISQYQTSEKVHEAQIRKVLCLKKVGNMQEAVHILAREFRENEIRPSGTYSLTSEVIAQSALNAGAQGAWLSLLNSHSGKKTIGLSATFKREWMHDLIVKDGIAYAKSSRDGNNDRLLAIDIKSGRLLWEFKPEEESLGDTKRGSYSLYFVVKDGIVAVNTDFSESLCRIPLWLATGMNACLAQRVIRETGRLPNPQRPLRNMV